LQKLKWYCQLCQKQCRDANGFKCHTMTEGHLQQMPLFSESSSSMIKNYSSEFMNGFLRVLHVRWGSKKILANRVYQDYIADKDHVHLNATRWQSVHGFVLFLKSKGLVELEESEKGPIIQYIAKSHNFPRADKATSAQWEQMERLDTERQKNAIEWQLEQAKLLQHEPVGSPVATEHRPEQATSLPADLKLSRPLTIKKRPIGTKKSALFQGEEED
jgi:DNA/RNA-binding protein KIN17